MINKKFLITCASLFISSATVFASFSPSYAHPVVLSSESLKTIVDTQTINEAPVQDIFNVDSEAETAIDDSLIISEVSDARQVTVFDREDGVQIVTQSSSSQLTKFSYEFPGKYLRDVEGYIIVSSDYYGEPEKIIDPAWSVDSFGTPVATHYEIFGSTLVQVVEPRNAAGVVVSDPYIRDAYTKGGKKMGQDLVFTRDELATAATGGGLCALINRIPTPWRNACGVSSLVAADALNRNKCIALRLIGFSYGPNVPIMLYVEC